MALQMNYDYYSPENTPTTIYNAYWRINSKNGLVGGKDEMHYVIEVFENADLARVEYPQALGRYTFRFIVNLNSVDDFIRQAYLHAKTTSLLRESVDV